jgi:hypothetical protein
MGEEHRRTVCRKRPGDRPLDEIIRGIKRGLVVGRFSDASRKGGDSPASPKTASLWKTEDKGAVSET